jgi:ubiquinone/menaquinone biosynthesis C-methylase UbiE
MTYLSLARRVPEAAALEPKLMTQLYGTVTRLPFVRTVYRKFAAGVLAQGVTSGCVLDLGTGPGYMAIQIAKREPELRIIGLDLALHMVEQARRRAGHSSLNGQVLWPQADAHSLPFADHSFDLVFSTFALHHWREPLRILNEIARVLAPDGRYYIADLCREVNAFQRLFAYGSVPFASLPFGSYWGYGGYYESIRAGYTRQEARTLLERSDLPPGQVELDSTWFVAVVTIASRDRRDAEPSIGVRRNEELAQ